MAAAGAAVQITQVGEKTQQHSMRAPCDDHQLGRMESYIITSRFVRGGRTRVGTTQSSMRIGRNKKSKSISSSLVGAIGDSGGITKGVVARLGGLTSICYVQC